MAIVNHMKAPMVRQRSLSALQRDMLRNIEAVGFWSRGDRQSRLLDGGARDLRIIESLWRRGLVYRSVDPTVWGDPGVWALTDPGLAEARR